jgi:hypothetical protein
VRVENFKDEAEFRPAQEATVELTRQMITEQIINYLGSEESR